LAQFLRRFAERIIPQLVVICSTIAEGFVNKPFVKHWVTRHPRAAEFVSARIETRRFLGITPPSPRLQICKLDDPLWSEVGQYVTPLAALQIGREYCQIYLINCCHRSNHLGFGHIGFLRCWLC